MGKHSNKVKKQKARAANRKKQYGTESYDTGSSEFSGEDAADYEAFKGGSEEEVVVVEYIRQQSSPCGRATSALFCVGSFTISVMTMYLANSHAPGKTTDCGEQNPLNVSYYNWLVIFGVSLAGVFVLQLLVALLSCCTRPDWEGDMPPDPKDLKMGARRIACASFVIMILGSIMLGWLAYGTWVFAAPVDLYNNGTTFAPSRANKAKFASSDCFDLHRYGFILELVGTAYVLSFVLSKILCGVGFSKMMSLLEPVLT